MSWIWSLCLPVLLTLGSLPGLLVSGAYSSPNALDNGDQLATFHRHKRSANCLDKYKTVAHHTACLEKAGKAANTGVSQQSQADIVNLHNKYRAEVRASNMLKLSWDNDIAMIAQKWAENCVTAHDKNAQRYIPGSLSVGQNIATDAKNWTQTIDLWKQEVKDFTFGGTNMQLGKVGHYTQLVWADTHKIGCGYAECGTTKFYVCDYGPAGNFNGFDKPYKQGVQCGDCSVHCSSDKLCDCPTTCLNLGELVRSNCTCKCRRDFYTGPSCSLECSKVKKDPDYCSGGYGNGDCTSVGVDCPNKCHVCPYGGKGYVEGSATIVQRPDNTGTGARSDVLVAVTMVTIAWTMTIGV